MKNNMMQPILDEDVSFEGVVRYRPGAAPSNSSFSFTQQVEY